MKPSRLGYVPALDGLRGIAISGVLACHLFGLHSGSVATGGFFGVDLFFVLSGFLITTLLLEERDRDGRVSLRGFYVRRARRLLPALGGLIALFLLVMIVGGQTLHGLVVVAAGALYVGNIAHLAGVHTLPLDHLWSLAEEEQFYLVWPVLLALLLRKLPEPRLLRWLAATAALVAAYRLLLAGFGAGTDRLYFGPDTHADGLIIGCAAAIYRRRGGRMPSQRVALFALAAVVAVFFIGRQTLAWMMFGLAPFNLAAAILVLAATGTGFLTSRLAVRPLVYLGAISYSLYVWHQFARWLLGWQHPWVALPLALLLAVASYHWIEQPFRRHRTRQPAPIVVATAGGT